MVNTTDLFVYKLPKYVLFNVNFLYNLFFYISDFWARKETWFTDIVHHVPVDNCVKHQSATILFNQRLQEVWNHTRSKYIYSNVWYIMYLKLFKRYQLYPKKLSRKKFIQPGIVNFMNNFILWDALIFIFEHKNVIKLRFSLSLICPCSKFWPKRDGLKCWMVSYTISQRMW